MAIEHQKCTNCGAMLELNSENRIYFCPFCGVKIPIEQDHDDKMIDYSKFVLKHEEEVRRQKVKEKEKNDKPFMILGVIALIGVLAFFAVIYGGHYLRVYQLEQLVAEIQEDIVAGRLDEASVKVTRVRLNDDYSSKETYEWNQQREALEKLIREKRR